MTMRECVATLEIDTSELRAALSACANAPDDVMDKLAALLDSGKPIVEVKHEERLKFSARPTDALVDLAVEAWAAKQG